MPFVVGETIGPYRILEQLGRGGMATVFKAYHAALDRYVALKALHPAFMEDPNFHARFQREARLVAKLEHPNIVPIYDFSEYENRPYLVMKYIPGETLKARLNAGPLALAETLRIVKAVGEGLSYAHAQGILHRDIKPSNVLLSTDGRIYLADFGLARIAEAGESTLSSDMMLGTPQYISPEQAMGQSDLDERTDIYSFGVMLYEMTVGQVPFSADTPFSIIHDHIYTPLPLPRQVNPRVPEAVERVLLKALAKDREDRYPTVDALVEAFTQAITAEAETATMPERPAPAGDAPTLRAEPPAKPAADSTPVAESPPESPPLPAEPAAESPKPRRRWRWWQIALTLILLLVCGTLALGVLASREGEPALPQGEPLPLDEAIAQVDENPNDPQAWLSLAASYWDAGQGDEARDALAKALDAAGDDPDFYLNVADSLAQNGAWVDAAWVYLSAIQRFFPAGEVPPDVMDAFHEAAYKAAGMPDVRQRIAFDQIAAVDPALAQVVEARALHAEGFYDDAFDLANAVHQDIRPEMPEAALLLAEIFYGWGDTATAREYLDGLLAREDTPLWVRQYIEELAGEAQKNIADAQAAVEANPDDPWMHLDLFEAYLAAGQYDQAEQTLQRALELGGDDPVVLEYAGDLLGNYNAWAEAAGLYAHAIRQTPEGERSPDLFNKVTEALYYSASEENAPDVFEKIPEYISGKNADQDLMRSVYRDALEARYTLYYGDPEAARAMIDDVVARAPKMMLLPRLIQGEIYLEVGEREAGQEILRTIMENPAAPAWMRDEAHWILNANE